MINALSRRRSTVDHHAVTLPGNPMIVGQTGGDGVDMADDSLVFLLHIQECRDMFARNYQDVDRRLGIDISKGHDSTVLINDAPLHVA